MIINHSLKFIFLHVPKTAGTSVTTWLGEYTGWNDIELGGTDYGEQIQVIYCSRFKLSKHSPASQIRRIVGPDIWNAYYKFAIVRHPLDRLVSAFQFYREWDHPGVAAAKKCRTFDLFLKSDYFDKDRRNCTRATGLQSTFLETPHNEALDRICRFETLAEDMDKVAQDLGIDPPQLSHQNPSKRGAYEAYFTPKTRSFAETLYADDFRTFGYALS